jgi:hypothetical protein
MNEHVVFRRIVYKTMWLFPGIETKATVSVKLEGAERGVHPSSDMSYSRKQ